MKWLQWPGSIVMVPFVMLGLIAGILTSGIAVASMSIAFVVYALSTCLLAKTTYPLLAPTVMGYTLGFWVAIAFLLRAAGVY